jgi:hypothetical protein
MGAVLTPDELTARTERAVAAAAAAGRDLGLAVDDARSIYDVFSVLVHLAPSPVVARVPTVLPSTLDPGAQAAQQRVELGVAGWLAERCHPVVAPSPLVPREPVGQDGFSMTFWQWVEEVPDAEYDVARRCALTARLHAALRPYPVELPFLVPLDPYLVDLDRLEGRPDLLDPADLDRARREWAAFAPLGSSRAAFEAAFPGVDLQPIHGDAPFYNVIPTSEGELCSDFEHVTLGPVEWDLVGAGPEGEAAYDAAAAQLGLRPLDRRVLRVMGSARSIQIVACLALAPELPLLVEGLRPVVDSWRASPFAGGLTEARPQPGYE